MRFHVYSKLYIREVMNKSVSSSRHQCNKLILFEDIQLTSFVLLKVLLLCLLL